MSNANDSVVIVGAGVMGLSAAYYALRSGFEVTVLEREAEDGDSCSLGNAGMVVPSHFVPLAAPGMMAKGMKMMLDRESPFYVRPRPSLELMRWAWIFYRHSTLEHVEACRDLLRDLHLESRRLFLELAKEGDFGLVKNGLLMLCQTPQGLDEEAQVAAVAKEAGLEAEVLDPAAAAKRDPGVTMDLAGAVHYAQDCHLDPARLIALLRRRVLELGGRVEYGVEVDRIEQADGRVRAVTAGERHFEALQFVVAGGAWSARLLLQLGLKLSMQAGKGYSLTLDQPVELPQLCSIFAEAKVAVTPIGGSLRFAGTMEVGGLERSINPRRVHGIAKSVPRYFPRFSEADFEGTEAWAGLRPVSPDGLPYLGKPEGLENLVVVSGHAMMGISLGPISGRLVSNLLRDEKPFRSVEALSLGRFS